MIVVVVFILLFAALWIEAIWRLALAALLWLPILFCAVAAMHWTASLHLTDPLASLYGFFAGGSVARLAMVLTLRRARTFAQL
jgi:hypothetical protein